jgi:hypothetical protein
MMLGMGLLVVHAVINPDMNMREIMTIAEAWAKRPDSTYWYDTETGTLIDCRAFHHTEFVMMAPGKFRLTPEAVMRAAGWKGDDYDAFCTWASDTQHDIMDEGVIEATIAAGFVRVNKEVRRYAGRQTTALSLQGSLKGCRAALTKFQEEGFFPDTVYTQGWKLVGDAVETFAKSGKIVSDERYDPYGA